MSVEGPTTFTIQNTGPTTVVRLDFVFDHPTYGTASVNFTGIKSGENSNFTGTSYSITGLSIGPGQSKTFTVDYDYNNISAGAVGATDNGDITIIGYNSSDVTDEIDAPITTTVTVVSGGGGGGGGGVTITLSPTTLTAAVIGQAYTPVNIVASGGTGPYTYEYSAGVPTGMTVTTSGVLQGTPDSGLDPGTATFTVTATDSLSQTGSREYNLTLSTVPVTPPNIGSFGFDPAYASTSSGFVPAFPNFMWNITGDVDSITITGSAEGTTSGNLLGVYGTGLEDILEYSEVFSASGISVDSSYTMTATGPGGSDTAGPITFTAIPNVSTTFNLLPSPADHGDTIIGAFTTTVADRAYIRRQDAGPTYTDVWGSADNPQTVTPGDLNSGINLGTADYYTTAGSVTFLLTVYDSTMTSNTHTETRTININEPLGTSWMFNADTTATLSPLNPIVFTVTSSVQNDQYYITFDTGSATGSGSGFINGLPYSGTTSTPQEGGLEYNDTGSLTPTNPATGYLRLRTSSDSSSGLNIVYSSPLTITTTP